MDDIRWKQRFENFERAFNNFKMVLNELKQNKDSFIYKMAIAKILFWNYQEGFITFQHHINLM